MRPLAPLVFHPIENESHAPEPGTSSSAVIAFESALGGGQCRSALRDILASDALEDVIGQRSTRYSCGAPKYQALRADSLKVSLSSRGHARSKSARIPPPFKKASSPLPWTARSTSCEVDILSCGRWSPTPVRL